ncbi:mu-type opioid receptor-like [Mytilus edulis]|uniref:mu-type opioid receptor-like n=1 Tax=Mytilus edulis TaxID=6550 RepID=UPI0039F0A114
MSFNLTPDATPSSTNSSSSFPFALPTLLIVFLTLQQIVFVIACTGNFFVIYVVLRHMSLKDNSNIFVLNLAIADFFTGMSSGVQIVYVFHRHLNQNVVSCLLRFQVVGCMTIASHVNVFLLSMDRYIAICQQGLYQKILTKNLSSIIVTLPWLISMALSLPPFFGWNEWETAPSCSFSLVYSTEFFWTTSSIVCSLNGLSFIAHFLIFFKIRKFYKRTRPLDELETEDKKLHKNIRGAKVMLIITIAFTICWTPFMSFSFAFANGYSTDFNLQETSHWLVFLGMLNSVINPVIYAWYKQDFRKACQKTCSRDSIQRAVVRIRQSNT